VVGGSGGRCFCCSTLTTLVTPLRRPGSANAAASVCLYIGNRKDHCSQPRCRPIVWPHPTAGLWISRTRGPVGDRVPSLCFDRCAMAPETRPLPAVSRVHPPATSADCPAANGHCTYLVTLLQLFCDVSGVPPPAVNRSFTRGDRAWHRRSE